MFNLAFANLWHHKLRSALVSFGVSIGVAMLVTMLALSHGTLGEVASRVKSVQADLIVLPSKSSLIFNDGALLSDKYIPKILAVRHREQQVVSRVIPAFLSVIPEMAGQQQRVFGVDPADFEAFLGKRRVTSGQVFPNGRKFKALIEQLRGNAKRYDAEKVPEQLLTDAQEMIIDDRLARAGRYTVGDKVDFLGRQFTICAIAESGMAGRVFVPIGVIRHIHNGGMLRSSLFFMQANPRIVLVNDRDEGKGMLSVEEAAKLVAEATHRRIEPLAKYDQMLYDSFKSVYVYINVANGIVLLVSFLFIMVTMYTMVLERRREIGILRSLGAGGWYIMGQTVFEALMLSLTGTAVGIALAMVGKWIIEHYRPLLTVDVRTEWLAVAITVGVVGGLLSAMYPGYRALRLDPVECLTNE